MYVDVSSALFPQTAGSPPCQRFRLCPISWKVVEARTNGLPTNSSQTPERHHHVAARQVRDAADARRDVEVRIVCGARRRSLLQARTAPADRRPDTGNRDFGLPRAWRVQQVVEQTMPVSIEASAVRAAVPVEVVGIAWISELLSRSFLTVVAHRLVSDTFAAQTSSRRFPGSPGTGTRESAGLHALSLIDLAAPGVHRTGRDTHRHRWTCNRPPSQSCVHDAKVVIRVDVADVEMRRDPVGRHTRRRSSSASRASACE